jgi:hypothetical protein
MTTDQFWYGDLRLLQAYQKAYIRNISYSAWVNGNYANMAHSISLSNAFAKKGAKKAEFPQWVDPFKKINKKKITKEKLETEFRKQQIEQNAWLFNRK